MQTRTANVILINGSLDEAEGMALVFNEMFRIMNISGKARAYYEDWYVDEAVENDDEIEYGVQIKVSGVTSSVWRGIIDAVSQPQERYGNVVVRED